jgi:phosphatidylserine/phosphatidylglycerophosphate/cardiolipin synthase-like enzyme
MNAEVIFTRNHSIANLIERIIENATISVAAALYRFNLPDLAAAMKEAARRGVSVRMVIERRKYDEDSTTQNLLKKSGVSFRLSRGRAGKGSKMHNKFAVVDGRAALTGSYNWTTESENENYENLVILHDLEQVKAYSQEFELLWEDAAIQSE